MPPTTKSKPKSTVIKFVQTCKDCMHAHQDDEGVYLCWGMPPIMMFDGDGDIPVRGLPINPDAPRCFFFQAETND